MAATCGHCGSRNETVAHVLNCWRTTMLAKYTLVPEKIENIKPVKARKPHALVKVVLTQWKGTAKESKSVTYRCRCGALLSPTRDKARKLLRDHKSGLLEAEYESREDLGRLSVADYSGRWWNAADYSSDEVFR